MNTLGKYALFVSIQLSVVALATAVFSVYKMNECRAKMDVHYVHCATKHNAIDDQIRMIKDGGKAEAYIDSLGHRSEPSSVLGIFEGDNSGEDKFAPDFNYPGATGFFNQTYLNYGGPTGSWKPHIHLTGDDPQQSPVGWERGKTAWKNGHNVNDPTDLDPETGRPYPPVGASVKVLSHVIRRTVGTDTKTEFFFTRLDFDETGLLVRAVPCTDWFVDPT